MDLGIRGRVALVAASSRGLGRASAEALAAEGVDLVLCGHDHQEAIHYVEHTKKGTVISTAGTVSSRSRGGRPSSANVITLSPEALDITTLVWSTEAQRFVPGPRRCFER